MKNLRHFPLLAALACATTLSAPGLVLADKADDTLRIAFSKDLDNANVYFSSARESTIFGYAVWDTLVERDPETREWVGNLAESFEWIDDLTLEFKLRPNVTFHNGEAFDADDVVFTLNHFSDPTVAVAMPNTVNWIKNAEKIDAMTVRVHLKAPFPAALDFLESAIQIFPDQYYQEVGDQGFSQNPVGTGPYKVEKIDTGSGYTLTAFDGYHEGGPRQKAQIKTVEVRSIPDVNTQLAEMMSGTIDFIWQVPEDLTQKLAARGGFAIEQGQTIRFGYVSMDVSGRSDAETPLKDLRVRQAINHAIDRKAIRDAFFAPTSEIINSICNPLQFGCEQDVTVYDFDPEKAKALLAEAGYPDGFGTTMYFYRDKPAAEAMAQMLANVGITVDLQMLKYAALADKQLKGEIPMGFVTWGSGSVADVSASTSKFFDGSDIDDVQDPALSATLKQADTTIDPDKRKVLYTAALRQIADQAYWVPLWTYTSNYVMSEELNFTPTPDEFVRFYDMSWK
ncbi:ABC transporter substrate-binding protein [Paracoccus xiamenensis]|uniref:ABC transporter substrate-binding protein n=1 Tax=Paracoccus xiamenensis TaxID=2714901 RepID=UPI00140B8F26|nr:ABC transporter substrate-binding protein [Paracoccus xiamenensis]NHF74406.1 ABC transporter substrate-binding protein [Paracoccus xiamenensis]